jgi:hypothetical protein
MEVPEDVRALIARHVPQLRYHPLEAFRADSVRTMVEAFRSWDYSTGLVSKQAGTVIARANPVNGLRHLSLSLLVPEGEAYWPDGPKATGEDHLAVSDDDREGDSHRMRGRPGWGDVVYCHWLPREGKPRFIQYWLFYYHNPFMGPLGTHEGDWEMVQVEVAEDGTPVAASYHQHDGARRRDWADVPRVNDVTPIVYVAKGSHASYYEAGTQRRFLGFIANDHTSDDGDHVIPVPYLIDLEADRWVEWPGRWGDHGSPEGPAGHGAWRKPEEVESPLLEDDEAGLLGEEPQGTPAAVTPARVLLEDDALVVHYELPVTLGPGETDPARVELALYGAAGPPTVRSFDVTGLHGEVRLPLPPSGAPYRLEAGVYDVQDSERMLPPVDVSSLGSAEPSAALEASAAPPAPPPPSVTVNLEEQLRVNVRAPEKHPDAAAALAQRLAHVELTGGPWHVRPLFASSDDPELSRWLTVSGSYVPAPGLDWPAAVLEAARAIDPGPDWLVEPQLPITSYRPDPPEDEDDAALEEPTDYAWALEQLRVPEARKLDPREGGAAGGEGIVIGQPDTGYTDHPELEEGAIDRLRDYDVLTGRDDAHAVLRGIPPIAFPSHGTSTASVAASRRSLTVEGTAPAATIIPIRAASTVVHFFNGDLGVAVEHARLLKVHVITMSMGGIGYPHSLRAAIVRAVKDGIIVLAAAGQPLPLVVEPASFPECLGIGGTVRGDGYWAMSARGHEVDVAAPAKKVWVAGTHNSGADPYYVAQHTGTSFSVALVAGMAALWLAHHGRDHVLETYEPPNVQAAFRSLLRKSARVPDGWNIDSHGAGIPDAHALLSMDLGEAEIDGAELDDAAAAPLDGAAWAKQSAAVLAPEGISADEAAERVTAVFGGDEGRLEEHARELVYRLMEDPRVRGEVLGTPGGGALLEDAPAYPALSAVASPSLRAGLA